MLNSKQDILTESGFYFMSYHPEIRNSVDAVEMMIKKVKVTAKDVLIMDDDETVSGYPDIMFSDILPDYVTKKFSKSVNTLLMAYQFDVKIECAINDSVGHDETLSVFIKSNKENMVAIVTQHINGQVDQTILRGQHSLEALKNFL